MHCSDRGLVGHWVRTLLLCLLLPISLQGCSINQLVSRQLADRLAQPEMPGEDDPLLVRDASPFYLKLAESVLQDNPTHRALAARVSAGFTQYAYAFVALEADYVESRDPAQADELRLRARQLYRRAWLHAMRGLEQTTPNLRAVLSQPALPNPLQPQQVELAYWAAASWGGLIALSKDDPEMVADLPQAVRLAQFAWELEPDWGQGSLSSLLATFEASRPGGSKAKAVAYFDQALKQSDGLNIGVYLGKAETLALPAGDRVEFDRELALAQAVKTPPEHPLAMSNALLAKRVRWLQSRGNDLF